MNDNLIYWLHLLSGPLIGAVIGYCTNYIAVKMLFRPHHEVKVANYRLPFTPGLIPKRQKDLAKAVGNAVEKSLLTEDDLSKMLLSESTENAVTELCMQQVRDALSKEDKLGEVLPAMTGEELYAGGKEKIKAILSEKIMNAVMDVNPGEIIAREGINAVQQMIAGTMFAMFLSGEMLESMAGQVGVYAETYIRENGPALVEKQLDKEIAELEEKSIAEFGTPILNYEDKIREKVKEIYRSSIGQVTGSIVSEFHIGQVIEEKIIAMDVMELEELVMSVMKHELGMIVNLGALIGFVLGLINIFL